MLSWWDHQHVLLRCCWCHRGGVAVVAAVSLVLQWQYHYASTSYGGSIANMGASGSGGIAVLVVVLAIPPGSHSGGEGVANAIAPIVEAIAAVDLENTAGWRADAIAASRWWYCWHHHSA